MRNGVFWSTVISFNLLSERGQTYYSRNTTRSTNAVLVPTKSFPLFPVKWNLILSSTHIRFLYHVFVIILSNQQIECNMSYYYTHSSESILPLHRTSLFRLLYPACYLYSRSAVCLIDLRFDHKIIPKFFWRFIRKY